MVSNLITCGQVTAKKFVEDVFIMGAQAVHTVQYHLDKIKKKGKLLILI